MHLICIFIVSPAGSISVTPEISGTTSFGSSESLCCSADGGPDNTFNWTVNGGPVISNSPELQLTFITGSDAGVYTCTVANDAGSDNVSTTITGIANIYSSYVVTATDIINCLRKLEIRHKNFRLDYY